MLKEVKAVKVRILKNTYHPPYGRLPVGREVDAPEGRRWVDNGIAEPVEVDTAWKDLSELDFPALRRYAKELGIKTHAKKRVEIEQEIRGDR